MTTIYEKSQGVFLDIKSCGSSVRWGVSVERRSYKTKGSKKRSFHLDFDFSISMTDCSRSITWSADGSSALAKKKIIMAISAFQDALRHVEKADAAMKREKKAIKNKSR